MIFSRMHTRSFNLLVIGLLMSLASVEVIAQEGQNKPPVSYPSPTEPVNCEGVTAYVETAMVMAQEEGENSYLIVIARLGDGERSRKLNLDRIKTVRGFMKGRRGKSIVAEGERTKGYGRLELYVGGKQAFVLPLRRNGNVDFWSCMFP